jgi:DEAD/DEAH box helicase domain-containing protein
VDHANKKAIFKVLPSFEYYTHPVVKTTITIQSATKEEILNYGNYSLLIGYGNVDVNSSLTGYLRFYQDGRKPWRSELKNTNPKDLKTTGFWLTLVPNKTGVWNSLIPGFSNQKSFHILHTLEHLLLREIVEHGYCDTEDIIGYTKEEYSGYSNPTIFFYDNYYKGLGLSHKIFDNIENLISKAIIRIMSCTCYEGCPACIYKRAYCEYNEKFTNKDLTKEFLKPLILTQTRRSKYLDQTNSSLKFTQYARDKFDVGDEYIPGWTVTEKNDVEYIIETAAGDIAYCTFEDGLY